ncbi:hypothetical protein [Bradyrhizobium sp. CCBAU 53415]|uniref:hypothetical protein n=1 Tax=Bradyrhizobium sp. CCBAU 53415 TaxID=1325119 RepID=UPI002305FAE8|nr:hypothetical protein [Bradyrhizobium sp. CCBAU 53415]
MADPTQYSFELSEVTRALVRQQGLTSGQWTLGIEFNFTAMMAGPNPNDVKPSALLQVNRLQLVQVGPDTVPGEPVVDAGKMAARKKIKTKA